MTQPRSEVFNAEEVGVYHCVSRCVRRAYLCGYDSKSGQSFEHRRSWIRDRLTFLVQHFCIELVSYAIMSNHLHSLIRNRPDIAKRLSSREVAQRWRKLFPLRWEDGGVPAEPNEYEISEIVRSKALVKLYRERLSSISWFNRCICEYIARAANQEDQCRGRFWEGRFKSQKVEDLGALLTCSVYIDLNPIRAEMAATPEGSDYTSVQDRIRGKRKLCPTPELVSIEEATGGGVTAEEYLELVDETGRVVKAGKRGVIPGHLAGILERLRIKPSQWVESTSHYGRKFKRVAGSSEALLEAARRAGKRWFHGLSAARAAFC